MPINKSGKKENQQNRARFAEQYTTLNSRKAEEAPASLNELPKNES